MFILVTYDIVDDKRRTAIARVLKDYGTRVQYSVFECLLTEKQFRVLRSKLAKKVKEEDSIRYYILCALCKEKILFDGSGSITKDENFYLI